MGEYQQIVCIITAIPSEFDAVKERLIGGHETELHGIKLYIHGDNTTVIACSGTDTAHKADIKRRLSPIVIDMESAAIGQCCYQNEIPFVSIRCISDNADDDGVMTYDMFEKISAAKVAMILTELLKEI